MFLKLYVVVSIYGLALDVITGKLMVSPGHVISSGMCPRDYFPTEDFGCHPLFKCADRHRFEVHSELTGGYVKRLYHASWDGNVTTVVFSVPRYNHTVDDFVHGVHMLSEFQHSRYVVQIFGYCIEGEASYLATKFYKHSSANKLKKTLELVNLLPKSEFTTRLALALDYLSTLVFLHHSPSGTRVMCDSNDLEKTLSQFLITDDLRLVVADLDALPVVNHKLNILIKCGHRELTGGFVAPEQLWPHTDQPFSDANMHGYDEKTDIWKIPNVLRFLLGQSNHASQVKLRMFEILRLCKEADPRLRPDAKYVRYSFLTAIKEFDVKVEL